jgi:hypothetical protein
MTTDDTLPTRQAIAVKDRSRKGMVTGKLKIAIELMVWSAARRAEAAENAGLTDHSLRAALKKPHVLRFYQEELRVLRESVRAKNFHRLDDIAEKSPNAMAKVAAIKTMEQLSDQETATRGSQTLPGLQIVIVQGGHTEPAVVDVTPYPTAEIAYDDDDPTIFRPKR